MRSVATTTAPIKTPTLNPGEKVAYLTQFLESIGESHVEMAEGRGIVGSGKPYPKISF